MGDVAMTVPVIQTLACAYPHTEFTMLSKPAFAPLFAGMPANVHFVGARFKDEHKGIRGLHRLLQHIDYRSFDAVADLHSVLRSRYICMWFLLAGKQVAAISKDRCSKHRLTRQYHKRLVPLQTSMERYARVFHRLGFTFDMPSMQKNSLPRRNIGIAPFAAHKGKIYPLHLMEQVVASLSMQTDETVYLFGAGKTEQTILEEWAARYPHVESLAGKHTLAEELNIMRSLRVMLSMDSANMHLASLVHTPVVSIWGATHPYAGFLGWQQQMSDCLQTDLTCRPCSVYGNKPCLRKDYACLNDIAPERVVRHITDKYL